MRDIIRKSTTIWSVGIAVAIILFMSIFLVVHTRASALTGSGRLITIHDRGDDKVFLSNAATVGDALKQEGVTLDSHDVVEPAASQKLVASEYQVNIYRARPVTVIDGAIREKIDTAYQTADQIAKDAGITLYPEDKTTLSQSDDLLADGAGLELTITRATAFNFDLYGTTTVARTQGVTVADMLSEKGIKLDADDKVSVPLSTPIAANMNVQVWREGTQTMTVTEPIAFDTQQIQDADQAVSYKAVQTPGVSGSKNVTYSVDIRDGQEVSRTAIATIVVTQPVTEVDVIGTKLAVGVNVSADQVSIMTQAGIAESDQGYVAYIVTHEGGWCAVRWQGDPGCTDHGSAPLTLGYGLVQATPGIKMASAGADWLTNPVTQLEWASSYAVARYGGWYGAYTHWVANHNW